MSAFEKNVTWQPRYGIARAHWDAMRNYAGERDLFILVRGGKEASIKWIEKGYPGKPLALKTKVDPQLGLLVARDNFDRKKALDAGHLVVQRAGNGYHLVGAKGTAPLPAWPTTGLWAHDGVVVDGAKKLPFTSDYDLATVLPAREFSYTRDLGQHMIEGSVTSAWAEQVRTDLNRQFGSERFCHGPQAQYDQRLANSTDKSEVIVAFTPKREASVLRTPDSVGWQTVQFRDLLVELYPGRAHQFNN